MNKYVNAAAIALALAGGAGMVAPAAAQGDQPHVLVMGTPVKGGGADLAVDFYSDGSAIAVNVDLGISDLAKAGAKTAGCDSLKLKASGNWQGGCSIVDGVIRFVAINLDMAPMPAGWHSLGTVRVASLPKSGVEGKVVTAANAKGEEIPVGFKYSWVD